MDMIGRIRRLHSQGSKSEREIARITGLSRNTVSKWLHGQVDGPPKYQRGEEPTKLTAFHEALRQALTADARRPRQQRRTARALYTEIKAAGYEGGYSRVTDFIRAWRLGEGQGAATNAFIPLAFALGEAYQFDWSEEGLVVGGIYYRVQVAHLKLCASRAFWLVAYHARLVFQKNEDSPIGGFGLLAQRHDAAVAHLSSAGQVLQVGRDAEPLALSFSRSNASGRPHPDVRPKARDHPDAAGHDQTAQRHRADHRAHEDGRSPRSQPTQGRARRRAARGDMRRRAQPTNDSGRASALLRPHRAVRTGG